MVLLGFYCIYIHQSILRSGIAIASLRYNLTLVSSISNSMISGHVRSWLPGRYEVKNYYIDIKIFSNWSHNILADRNSNIIQQINTLIFFKFLSSLTKKLFMKRRDRLHASGAELVCCLSVYRFFLLKPGFFWRHISSTAMR